MLRCGGPHQAHHSASHTDDRTQLPIYPTSDSEPLVTLVETQSPIAPYIARAREATAGALSGVSGYVEKGVSRWISFERSAEREYRRENARVNVYAMEKYLTLFVGEMKSVFPADESLTPGIIYVLIAGLSGSVLTRTRSFPLRLLAPPLLALVAMPYFLPKTSHNLRGYLSDLEDEHFPTFANRHDQMYTQVGMHWDMLRHRLGSAGNDAKGWGSKAVEGIESSTGLRVGDIVRKGKDKVEMQKERVQGRLKVGEEPVQLETVGYVVETKPVAEIVAPIASTGVETGSAAKPTTGEARMV